MVQLLSGMDNSILILFMLIITFLLYILWNILKYIREKRTERIQENHFNYIDPNNRPLDEHEECSVCTERIKHRVELDCRHSFCGKCIMDYYDTIRSGNMKCPLCRNEIRLINPLNLVRNEETQDFYDKITRYNHRNLNGYNYVRLTA